MSDHHFTFEEVQGFARLDHDRAARQGLPEFVYAGHKTPEQVAAIMASMVARQGCALASRVAQAHADAVRTALPEAHFNATAGLITVGQMPRQAAGLARVVAAGTSDLPVAEEAVGVLEFLGDRVERLYDVGVAGVHRLLAHVDELAGADVLIVVAGMEGALPTVVGGLVAPPIIAVPTSVGYGASLQGLAALLGMLNSCAPGVCVVNIDNGLGAAAAAHRILNSLRRSSGSAAS
ncbi:MAG: nickel pincer cofactor biosynthesis protein LarB [Anaerolineae bacterium]|nr:nickel pincer cofactor biosynthesis protein LarB [Anaerolineae bacterium]